MFRFCEIFENFRAIAAPCGTVFIFPAAQTGFRSIITMNRKPVAVLLSPRYSGRGKRKMGGKTEKYPVVAGRFSRPQVRPQ